MNLKVLGGVGIAIAVAAALVVGSWTKPENPTAAVYMGEPSERPYISPRTCDPKELAKLPSSQRLERADICDEKKDQSLLVSNDLVQQTRSAVAAEAQVSIARQALRMTWAQTVAGVLTFAAAAFAAVYAAIAAEHSRLSAVAAEATTRAYLAYSHPQEMLGLSFPGWQLTFPNGNLQPIEQPGSINIGLKNTGPTEASSITVEVDGYCMKNGVRHELRLKRAMLSIPGQGTRNIEMEWNNPPFLTPWGTPLEDAKVAAEIVVKVKWVDVFGRTWNSGKLRFTGQNNHAQSLDGAALGLMMKYSPA